MVVVEKLDCRLPISYKIMVNKSTNSHYYYQHPVSKKKASWMDAFMNNTLA